MDPDKLRNLLSAVQKNEIDIDKALDSLRTLPYDDLEDYARLDVHRALRNSMPEVVLCESKTIQQAASILARLWEHHDRVLGTRVPPEMAKAIQEQIPQAHYDPTSRLLTLERTPLPPPADDKPYAMVVCGGTSDLPVAEEAAQVLRFLGHRVERAYDVGVAGLHRLLGELPRLMEANVVIAIAGMEGALTSVVAGYGVNFHGVAPLLTMLNSCASGVAVMNIDNGYGAAVFAHLILQQIECAAR
jgi:NCAIR mutase (PurE)-related protein